MGHVILPVGVRLIASFDRTTVVYSNSLVKGKIAVILKNMKRATNQDGYNLLLTHFMVDGKNRGEITRMAEALGVSRAVATSWRNNGIPPKYIPKLKKLTGLTGRQMQPETAAIWD